MTESEDKKFSFFYNNYFNTRSQTLKTLIEFLVIKVIAFRILNLN